MSGLNEAIDVRRKTSKPRPRERGVDRVLQLLEFLHQHRQPVRVGELAKRLNAPRSSIYSLVGALTQAGLLETVGEDGKIFFGKAVYLYGVDYIRENSLVRRGRKEVDRLARDTGETSELCILQNGKYTIIHMSPGSRPFRISSAVGLQIPVPWTASGRLLLAHLDRHEIEAFVSPEDLSLPDGTRIDLAEFIDAIAEARQQGYCVTRGLVDTFTQCIAAPIYGADRHVEATLCFVVPSDTPPNRTRQLVEILIESGKRLSISEAAGLPIPVGAPQ